MMEDVKIEVACDKAGVSDNTLLPRSFTNQDSYVGEVELCIIPNKGDYIPVDSLRNRKIAEMIHEHTACSLMKVNRRGIENDRIVLWCEPF